MAVSIRCVLNLLWFIILTYEVETSSAHLNAGPYTCRSVGSSKKYATPVDVLFRVIINYNMAAARILNEAFCFIVITAEPLQVEIFSLVMR